MVGNRVLGQEGEVIQGATSEAVLVVPLAARGNVLRKSRKMPLESLLPTVLNKLIPLYQLWRYSLF